MVDWRHAPPLASLRAFEAAARHRSFSLAARDLNVTHAAIAQHVRKLEAHLGQSLVTREGRGIAVTPGGLALAQALTEGFGTITGALDRMRTEQAARPLAVSVTPAFATNWLMPRIGDFWTRHPEIALNIQPVIEVVDLRHGDVDLAIRHGDGNWPGLEVELLTDGDFWVVVHPRLLAGRKADCLSDVADLPWLMESYMLERRAMVEREGIDLNAVRMQLMSTNWMVLSAAQAGHGVTVQPRTLVERQVAAGEFVRICALESSALGYYLVSLPGPTTGRMKAFRRWLKAQVAANRA